MKISIKNINITKALVPILLSSFLVACGGDDESSKNISDITGGWLLTQKSPDNPKTYISTYLFIQADGSLTAYIDAHSPNKKFKCTAGKSESKLKHFSGNKFIDEDDNNDKSGSFVVNGDVLKVNGIEDGVEQTFNFEKTNKNESYFANVLSCDKYNL